MGAEFKETMGFRQFLLRGLEKVNPELNLKTDRLLIGFRYLLSRKKNQYNE